MPPFFWYPRGATTIRIGSYIFQQPPELAKKALVPNVMIEAVGILLFTSAGFQMFLRFINTEGSAFIRAQAELAAAQAIQHTLGAGAESAHHGHGNARPLGSKRQVGGDIVDLVDSGNGVSAYLADGSGHGLPAGIVMGMLKTALRSTLDSQTVDSALLRVNRVLPAPMRTARNAIVCLFACVFPSLVVAEIAPLLHGPDLVADAATLRNAYEALHPGLYR